MASLHKILIVGHGDECRGPAYDIISYLREFGYSADLCHANDDENPSDIKAIQVLDAETSLSGYEGIVFLDDGGDPEAAQSLAKKAIEKDLVVGAHGSGVFVVSETGGLEDQYVCHGLPEIEGATVVDAPSVRSDKFVTALSECSLGFAVLLVDALGGKVNNIVRAKGSLPERCSLIIAPMEKWSTYWPLARKMREKGNSVVISDWDDVDVQKKELRQCALFDVDEKDLRIISSDSIPRSIWFREANLTDEDIAFAVESLEKIGCVNVNSSDAIRKLIDKETSHLLASMFSDVWVYDKNNIDLAVEKLMAKGARIASAMTGNKELRVIGQGEGAVIVKEGSHSVADAMLLKKALLGAFKKGRFAIKDATKDLRLGGKRFKLYWVMRRSPDGWRPASRLAVSGDMTCCAQEVLRLVLPDEMAFILEDADALSALIAMVLESMAGGQGMSEMGMLMSFDGDMLGVDSVSPIPDEGCPCSAKLAKIAQALNLPFEPTQPTPPEDLSHVLVSQAEDPLVRRVLEREMANEDIWPQPDGKVAVRTFFGIKKYKSLEELASKLKEEAIEAVKKEIEESETGDPMSAAMASRASRRARHRLRLALEMARLQGDTTKTAGVYPSSVAGPYAHLELPIHERVFEWNEGEDWLTDRDKAISDQHRYNPEYDKVTTKDSEGFYFVWDEQRRTPTDWLHVLEGDTPYKTRNLLAPGRLF